jgi:hypothetical protein
MRARLLAYGIAILDERDFGNGNSAIYVADPDGNILDLTERRTDWAGEPMAAIPIVRGWQVSPHRAPARRRMDRSPWLWQTIDACRALGRSLVKGR